MELDNISFFVIFCFNFFYQTTLYRQNHSRENCLNANRLLQFYLFRLLQYSKYPNANANAKATRRRVTVTAIAVEFVPLDSDASSLKPSCGFSVVEVIGVSDWLGGLEDIFWYSVGTDVGNIWTRIRKKHMIKYVFMLGRSQTQLSEVHVRIAAPICS